MYDNTYHVVDDSEFRIDFRAASCIIIPVCPLLAVSGGGLQLKMTSKPLEKSLSAVVKSNLNNLTLFEFEITSFPYTTTGVQNRSRPIKLTRRFHRGKKTT